MEQAWTVRRRRDAEHVQCPLCHDALADDAQVTECADCSAAHHSECWADLARCATCAGARGRAPAAIVVAPSPAPRATRGCEKAGCRRLVHLPRVAPRAGRGETNPTLCHPHGVIALGFGIVGAAGAVAVILEVAAWIGAMDPTDRRFPMKLGLACFYYGIPIALLAWGLLTLAWGLVAERTEPNEPVLKKKERRPR